MFMLCCFKLVCDLPNCKYEIVAKRKILNTHKGYYISITGIEIEG